MSTQAKIDANRANSAKSTGPTSEAGKAASSGNSLTDGLYTRHDFVLPEEADIYKEFFETMLHELRPATLLEKTLANQIAGAAWRLRRCDLADGGVAANSTLEPLLDPTLEKQIRSVERARAQANSALHRATNQLRKLQQERQEQPASPAPEPEPKPEPALRPDFLEALRNKLDTIMNDPGPNWDELDRKPSRTEGPGSVASFCKTPPQVGRNAPCPCKSGLKFKRCCLGKVA